MDATPAAGVPAGATGQPMIVLDALAKRFADGTVAVDDLDLTVARGEICMLIGPSGCGKTTTLRMVNRLIEPTSGRVVIDGSDVTAMDPVQLRRRVGYVIQQVGLFPHQTIGTNVATVPRLLGWDRERTARRVRELLDLVGLDPARYARRYPHQLSGGQRQRVGVARALAADPPVLLMDEPFGAVDPQARERLQVEFLRLRAALGTTVLFVTHDLDEAVRLGDRVALLSRGGHLEQTGTPAALLAAPRTTFVRDFVGADREVRLLSLTSVRPADLDRPPLLDGATGISDARAAAAAAGSAGGPAVALRAGRDAAPDAWLGLGGAGWQPLPAPISPQATLREALAAVLAADSGMVPVRDGSYVGLFTAQALHRTLRDAAREAAAAPAEG